MGLSGYIIEKYNNMGNSYTCGRLLEEAEKQGIVLDLIGMHDTAFVPEGIINENKLLEKRDFSINRYKWGRGKDRIGDLVKKSYNATESFNTYVNKYEQVLRLKSDEYIIPHFIMGTSSLKYQFIVNHLGNPFVAKGLESSMGREIILVESERDYLKIKEEYGFSKEWLFEEFIKTSLGRDIRFYSVRGKVVACMQRISQGDFRANVALGAKVEPLDITPNIRQIAKDIYYQTGLDFLGIDLLFGEKKPYFCEINVMPGLEGIESASHINVAKIIIDTIREDFVNG